MFLSKYINDNVEEARNVPGDIALQTGGKGALRELSLVEMELEMSQMIRHKQDMGTVGKSWQK